MSKIIVSPTGRTKTTTTQRRYVVAVDSPSYPDGIRIIARSDSLATANDKRRRAARDIANTFIFDTTNKVWA